MLGGFPNSSGKHLSGRLTQVKVEKGSKQECVVSLGHNESRGEPGRVCPGLSGVLALRRHLGIFPVHIVSWEKEAHPGGGAMAMRGNR